MSLIFDPIKYEIIRLYYLIINKMGEMSGTIGGYTGQFNKFAEQNTQINFQVEVDTFIKDLCGLQAEFISEVYDTNVELELEEINNRLVSTLNILEVDMRDISGLLLSNKTMSPIITQENGTYVKSVKNQVDYFLDAIKYEKHKLPPEAESNFKNYLRKKYFLEIVDNFSHEPYRYNGDAGNGVGFDENWGKNISEAEGKSATTVCTDFAFNVLRLLIDTGTSHRALEGKERANAVAIAETFNLKRIGELGVPFNPRDIEKNLDQEYIYLIAIFKINHRCGTYQANNPKRYDEETWFKKEHHVREKVVYKNNNIPTSYQKGEVLQYGTTHTAFLNFEDGKLMITHQTDDNDDSVAYEHVLFNTTRYYKKPEEYLIEVYQIV